jgi:hypothetical protein
MDASIVMVDSVTDRRQHSSAPGGDGGGGAVVCVVADVLLKLLENRVSGPNTRIVVLLLL